MSTVKDIYEQLFTGERLAIRLATRKEFDSLRVALHKHHQHARDLLELTTESLCASYDAAQGLGTFWLGAPLRAKRQISYEIVSAQSDSPTDAA